MRTRIFRPIIPILASYIIGLITGYYLTIPFHIIIALLFIFASLTAVSILFRNFSAIFLIFSALALFILGVGRMEAVLRPSFPDNRIANLMSDEPMSLEGTVGDPPERRLDRSRLYVDLSALYIGDTPYPVTGKLLLTIGGKETSIRYGDTIRFLAKVKRPRNFHNPGGFDYERYLAMMGVYATAYLKSPDGIVKTGEATPSFSTWIEGMREAIRDNIYKNAGSTAPLMIALVTGDQGEIPKDTREAFSRAGTAHILAISGEHIGLIIAAFFSLLLRLLKRSERVMLKVNIYKASAALTLPVVLLYSMIAGSGFSIVRAAIMGGAALAALLLERRRDIPSLIASASFLILVFEPQALFDISFQLSFASVISIAVIFPYLERDSNSGPEGMPGHMTNHLLLWFRVIFLVTIAATLGTVPIVAYYFNRVSLISPVANMITVPLVGFITVPLGLISSAIIPFSETVSGWLISFNSALISSIAGITGYMASIPFSSIRVVTPNLFEISLFYLLLIIFIHRDRVKWSMPVIILAIATIVSMESFYILRPLLQKELRVTFLDVGQGESALIEFPGGKRMLIDGGGMTTGDFDIGERVIAPFLWHKRIARIDYLVLSHPNSDHYSGLPFMIRNFTVGEVWEGGVGEGSEGYADFKKAVMESGSRYRNVSEDDSIEINNTVVDILNPPKGYRTEDDRGANNGSLVLRIKHGNTSFLFTGDIEKEAEQRLCSKGNGLKCTVLKVPHHGSLTSSTVDFLDKVRPEKAVFSVGYKNSFGFPKNAVLKRYSDIDADIYRTDMDGAVLAVADRTGVSLRKAVFR